jgi:DNA-binding Xre family transcriptional regulator
MAKTKARPRLRESIAGEIRVAMVRRQVTGVTLAQALGKSQAYVSRRLSGDTAFDVDDLETIAATLGVKVADLIGHAERGDGAYVSVGGGHVPVTASSVPMMPLPRGPLEESHPGRGWVPAQRRPQLTGR